jgi:hypothetical protein
MLFTGMKYPKRGFAKVFMGEKVEYLKVRPQPVLNCPPVTAI